MNNQKEIPLVLGGGGITGLCRLTGVLLAFEKLGIQYTSIHGTSAGAIAGALLSAGYSPVILANIINNLEDSDLREKLFLWQIRMHWVDHIFKTEKIERLLDTLLPANFDEMTIPLSTWAVNKRTNDLVNTMRPELAESPAKAVLASLSIPCIFPPVELLDGCPYWDGGLRASVPMIGDWRECEHVYVVIPSDSPHDYKGRDNLITSAIRAMNIKCNDEKLDLVAAMADEPNVTVIWPDVPTDKGMMHFDHSLIRKCYDWTLARLKKDQSK